MRRTAVVATVVALVVAAGAAATTGGQGVWVDGAVEDFLATGLATSAAHAVPLYVIAAVDPKRPLHSAADSADEGFGAHDHVMQLPRPGHAFHGTCDLTLVVPGPKSSAGNVRTRRTLTPDGVRRLLYAARVGGALRSLTSAATVVAARRAGLASFVRLDRVLVCQASPRTTP